MHIDDEWLSWVCFWMVHGGCFLLMQVKSWRSTACTLIYLLHFYSKIFVVKYSYPRLQRISYIVHNNYLAVHERSVKNGSHCGYKASSLFVIYSRVLPFHKHGTYQKSRYISNINAEISSTSLTTTVAKLPIWVSLIPIPFACMAFLHAKPSDVLCYVIPSAIYPSVGQQSCLSPVESTPVDCSHFSLQTLSSLISIIGLSFQFGSISFIMHTWWKPLCVSLCWVSILFFVITLCPYCFEFYKQFSWGIINTCWTLHVQTFSCICMYRHFHVFACKTNNSFNVFSLE